MVRGETDKTASDIHARSFMARALAKNWKKCKAEGQAQNGQLKNQSSIMQVKY